MNFSPVVLTGAGTSGIFVLIAYIAVFAAVSYTHLTLPTN